MHRDSLETSMDEVWNIFIFQNQRNKKQLPMHDHVGKQKNASIKNISASSKYQVIIGLHTKRTHMFTGGINSLHTNAHYSNPIRTLPPRTWSRPNEETSLFVLNLPENQAANSSLNARSFGALFIGWLKRLYATSMRYRAMSSCKKWIQKVSKYDTSYSCVAWVMNAKSSHPSTAKNWYGCSKIMIWMKQKQNVVVAN